MVWCYDFKKLKEREFKNMADMARCINIGLPRISKYFKSKAANDEFKLIDKRYLFSNYRIKRKEKTDGYNLYIELNFDTSIEQWRIFNDTKFEVSSLGRIRKPIKDSYRYYKPYMTLKGKNKNITVLKCKIESKEYRVVDLIKKCFLSDKDGVIYYLNGDNLDNRVDNLKIISRKEHGKITGGRSKSRMVCKINNETDEVVEIYRSAREAGRENFCSYQTILDNISGKYKNGVICIDFKYKWFDEVELKK